MKALTTMALGLIMSTIAVPALATSADRQQLADCKSELRAIYGEDTGLRLKSISKAKKRMRIWTVPVDGEGLSVDCRKDASGTLQLTDRQGVVLVNPNHDSINKVSVNK